MSRVAVTPRLQLRPLRDDQTDATHLLGVLNEPDFHRYIGDRGVRTSAQAQAYLRRGPMASYAEHG